MGRSKKLNADYYLHDTSMRNDRKIQAIRRKYGLEGYGAWCILLEVLADADYFQLQVDDVELELLAADFGVEAEWLISFLEFLDRLKLVVWNREGGILECHRLTESMQPLLQKREAVAKRVVKNRKRSNGAVTENKKDVTSNKTIVSDNNEVVTGKKPPSIVYSSIDKNSIDNSSNSKGECSGGQFAVDAIDFFEIFELYAADLSVEEFGAAAAHFKTQVTRSGNAYETPEAIFKHFSNWYNKAKSSGLLATVVSEARMVNERKRGKLLRDLNQVVDLVNAVRSKRFADLVKMKMAVSNAEKLLVAMKGEDVGLLTDDERSSFQASWNECLVFFERFNESSDELLQGFLGEGAKVVDATTRLEGGLKSLGAKMAVNR